MANRNYFTDKFKVKSNQELKNILESDSYVLEAKLAAYWILKERGEETNYELPKPEPKKYEPWFSGKHQDPERKRYYEEKVLAFGITCLIAAFYLSFESLFTSRNSLIELSGTIKNSEVIVDRVSSRNRLGYEAKSRRATLFFSLNEYPKIFKLAENIGQDYSHEEYELISKSLKNSRTVSVWINESEIKDLAPKVFQIDTNRQTILDFKTVKTEHAGISIYLFLFGAGMTGLALYSKYPKRTRKILGMD